MPTRLTGNPSLAYVGVEAASPPNITQHKTDPVTTDYFNFNTGDLWLNSQPDIPSKGNPANSTYRIWMLVAKVDFVATWIMISGGTGALLALQPDVGAPVFPAAGIIDVFSQPTCGATVFTSNGGGNLFQLNVTDVQGNTTVGLSAGNLTMAGAGANRNTSLGFNTLNALTTGANNTMIGHVVGDLITTGQFNTGVGSHCLTHATTGNANCGIGANTFGLLTTGINNTGLGTNCGFQTSLVGLTTGNYNVLIGFNGGNAYTSSESSNVLINNGGVLAESNTLRISSSGTGNQQVSTAYIGGIYNVPVTGQFVVVASNDQVGTGNFTDWTAWTPTVNGATPGTTTYSVQLGMYTRIANVVTAHFTIAVTAATGTGTLVIGNLPFTVATIANYNPYAAGFVSGLTFPANTTYMQVVGIGGTTTAQVNCVIPTSGVSSFLQMSNTTFTISGTLIFRPN